MSTPERYEPQPAERDLKDNIRIVATIALFVLLALFVILNTDDTNVDFIFTDADAPLIFVLIGTAIAGAIVSHLGQYLIRRRRQQERKER